MRSVNFLQNMIRFFSLVFLVSFSIAGYAKPVATDLSFLTAEEQQYLQQNPIIKTANSFHWPPFASQTQTGQTQGLIHDYRQQLEKVLGVEFKLVKTSTKAEMFDAFYNGDIDLLLAAGVTGNRKQNILFSKPYLHLPLVVVADSDMQYIGSLANLKQYEKLTVIKSSFAYDEVRSHFPTVQLIEVDSVKAGLQKVFNQEAIGFVGVLPEINHEIKQQGLFGLFHVIGQSKVRFDIAMGVVKGNPVLHSIIEKTLVQIEQTGQFGEQNRWLRLDTEQHFQWTHFVMDYGIYLTLLIVLGFAGAYLFKTRHQKQVYETNLLQAQRQAALEKAEQEKQYRQEQAQIFSMLTHEIKTPLAIIDGALYSLNIMEGPQTPEMEKRNERIRRGVKRINDLVELFHQKGQLDSESFELQKVDFNLYDACESVISKFDRENIILDGDKNVEIYADQDLIEMVVFNLLDNATKYSADNKPIVVKVSSVDGLAQIDVIDHGEGVPESQVSGLFIAYVRGHEHANIPGLGLGLYSANKIMKLHQGSLHYSANPIATGAVFTVKIALKSDNQPSDEME